MVDPKELRIGNLIFADTLRGFPLPHVVVAQDIADIANGRITGAAIDPIPLTEQWLTKLGFALDYKLPVPENIIDTIKTYSLNYGRKTMRIPTWYEEDHDGDFNFVIHFEFELMGFGEIADTNTVESVHQLQNLWNILTGQELIYTI